jgi:hypothetical protein
MMATLLLSSCSDGPTDAAKSLLPGQNAAAAPVLVGAGNVARCDAGNDERTAALVGGVAGTVFALGDQVRASGSLADYETCYAPTWGTHKHRTRPAAGDLDYQTAGGDGYFAYFGAAAGDRDKGYYSYNLGQWHVVVLNSNLSMAPGSPQHTWLLQDLALHPRACTVAYWHHPRFSSRGTAARSAVKAAWSALYEAGAEVVLNAHYRVYERFAPQDPDGRADPSWGMRQFTVGTGGHGVEPFDAPRPNSELRASGPYGVLKLTLADGGYGWEFIPVAGESFTDAGTGACHPRPTDPVLVGAGNIARCSSSALQRAEATAALLDGIAGTVFTAGDNAFPNGTLAEYQACYHPNWGRHKARTRATIGNHEYGSGSAAGSFDYFQDRAGPRGLGYYSYDLGDWHVIHLNDNPAHVPFTAGSAQDQWLAADLAATTKPCVIAIWHTPLFLSSNTANYTQNPSRRILWQRLYDAGADVIVNGHQHHYERFAPMRPDGTPDAAFGLRSFNVGTGGESLSRPTVAIHPQSQAIGADYGVLKLTLGAGSYWWEFVPVAGAAFRDAGQGSCHGRPPRGA